MHTAFYISSKGGLSLHDSRGLYVNRGLYVKPTRFSGIKSRLVKGFNVPLVAPPCDSQASRA